MNKLDCVMYWSGHHGHDLIVDGFTNYLCSHEY